MAQTYIQYHPNHWYSKNPIYIYTSWQIQVKPKLSLYIYLKNQRTIITTKQGNIMKIYCLSRGKLYSFNSIMFIVYILFSSNWYRKREIYIYIIKKESLLYYSIHNNDYYYYNFCCTIFVVHWHYYYYYSIFYNFLNNS